jgi:DNA-binding SARP family transcriptional activator
VEHSLTRRFEPKPDPAPDGDGEPTPRSPVTRVRVLDTFHCEYHGHRLSLPHSSQRVLAMLALVDHPVRRTDVCQLLWPHHDAELASGSLRTAVWRLRRVCPALVLADQRALGLHPDVRVDYRELVRRVERIRRSEQTGLLEAHAGIFVRRHELLPGWYDDWVIPHRERLRELTLGAMRSTAQAMYRHGHLMQALDLAMQALAVEPLDEETHRLVARIHLDQGNAAEARRQYQLYASVLRLELGLRPSEEFRGLVGPRAGHPALRRSATPSAVAGLPTLGAQRGA